VSGPDAAKIGLRVSMLIRDEDGHHRELLGKLLTTNTIVKRDLTEIKFNPDNVISWRVVPEQPLRKPTSQRIREIEQASSQTWPATEVVTLGGWELRASGGFSHRANSACPLGAPPLGEPIGELRVALSEVVNFYRRRGLTPLFQVPLPSYQSLDSALELEGWVSGLSVSVQTCELAKLSTASEHAVEITPRPDEEWLALYQRPLGRNGFAVLTSGSALFATIRKIDQASGKPVVAAIGRAATFEGWCGISAIRTAEHFYRQGLAKSIIRSLALNARSSGAERAFLQVSVENEPAMILYKSFGFIEHHVNHYRSIA
jgi:ribosomal protein S18 acetylase RimI-like enzyme